MDAKKYTHTIWSIKIKKKIISCKWELKGNYQKETFEIFRLHNKKEDLGKCDTQGTNLRQEGQRETTVKLSSDLV